MVKWFIDVLRNTIKEQGALKGCKRHSTLRYRVTATEQRKLKVCSKVIPKCQISSTEDNLTSTLSLTKNLLDDLLTFGLCLSMWLKSLSFWSSKLVFTVIENKPTGAKNQKLSSIQQETTISFFNALCFFSTILRLSKLG